MTNKKTLGDTSKMARRITTTERLAKVYLARPYARVVIPEDDGSFRAEIVEFPGCMATGDTPAEAVESLEGAALDWLIAVIESDQSVPEPLEVNNEYSGKLVLRFPKSLHKKATWVADREGVSLNQFIVSSLAEAVGERNAPRNVYVSFFRPGEFSPVGLSGTVGAVTKWTRLSLDQVPVNA